MKKTDRIFKNRMKEILKYYNEFHINHFECSCGGLTSIDELKLMYVPKCSKCGHTIVFDTVSDLEFAIKSNYIHRIKEDMTDFLTVYKKRIFEMNEGKK